MSPRDHDAERVQAALRAERLALGTQTDNRPVISDPGNGRKWWRETWGKAIGSLLGALLLAVVYWTATTAMAFTRATQRVYALPPRVDQLEGDVAILRARPAPMPSDLQEDLRAFLKAAKQEKRKP